eukprot:CAMPEP_0183784910 /NCGR_PEP_ID=MMETSP0739-20130205/66231_1 /TAXON_ID=385413 /ORGANISM="Thalassiosira miniscula, Strain CCMP1093" /LENGTH=556 /DNA_ID=CAMNT_0026028901 /DNA_START=69 /DNA_END=1739 /DNA_ORIENTATION=-
MEQPKRPLSAYNLYYRYKRSKILEAIEGGDGSPDAITRLILADPGLESYPSIGDTMSPKHVQWLRRTEIRSALLQNLSPKETRSRTHLKAHGGMSFVTMSKLMCDGWKFIDEFARCVFEELAEEGRKMYRKRVAEYEDLEASHKKKIKTSNSTATSAKEDHPDKEGKKGLILKPIVATNCAVSSPKESSEANMNAPKRPLTAYNLFYKYKRLKILDGRYGMESVEKVNQLIHATPGLEDYLPVLETLPPEEAKKLIRTEIRGALEGKLFPKDVRTRNRFPPHAIFANSEDMTKKMSDLWKSLDAYSKSVFQELAGEGRKIYQERVAEHNSKCASIATKKIESQGRRVSLSEDAKPEVFRSNTPTGPTADIFEEPCVDDNAPAKKIESQGRRVSLSEDAKPEVFRSNTPTGPTGTTHNLILVSPEKAIEGSPKVVAQIALEAFPLLPDFDLDGITHIANDPNPISADIFEEPCVDDNAPEDAASVVSSSSAPVVAQNSSNNASRRSAIPPFSFAGRQDEPGSRNTEREVSVDDFMKLIETLDENISFRNTQDENIEK